MSEPPGPTGVIVLKKIGDNRYEQYGRIVMSATGRTQITITQARFDSLFRQNIEQRETWVEDFASRLHHAPTAEQSSFNNTFAGAWSGGSWSAAQVMPGTFVPQATISGGVAFGGGSATPHAELDTNESQALQQMLSRTDRNPTWYGAFSQFNGPGNGGQVRFGLADINNNLAFAGIGFLFTQNSSLFAICSRAGVETQLATGVTMAPDQVHRGRFVVSGKGTSVAFYVDSVLIGSITTNIPTATTNLVPRIEQTNAAVPTTVLDYLALEQDRVPS